MDRKAGDGSLDYSGSLEYGFGAGAVNIFISFIL